MRPPIEIVSPCHKTLELSCDRAAFRKIAEFVIGQLDADTAKQISLEKLDGLMVFERSEPEVIHPMKERARNIFALWGCGLFSYVLIMLAAGCVALMGLGLSVVMGWLQAG